MSSIRWFGYATALLVFAVDQAVKYVVVGPFDLANRGQIEILPIFNLTWVPNYGVSGGFLTAYSETARWALVAVTAAIATFVAVWIWRERNRMDVLALSLILGGAAGNIVDRIRLGHVIDYADLHFGEFRPFLVFNVADAAITIGVALLILRAIFPSVRAKPAAVENGL